MPSPFAWLVLALTLHTACGASAHQKLLMASMASLDAAEAGFADFDGKHQLDLVASSSSRDDATTKLAAYRASRDKIVADMVAGYKLIEAAWKADTDPSVATAVAAVTAIGAALVALGVSK